MNINRIISIIRSLKEEAVAAPTNSVGGGNIAGLPPDHPPVNRKKKKPPIIARGLLPGARKRWSNGK